MSIFADFFLALFSTFGLLALIWLCFGRLLAPDSRSAPHMVAILVGKGDGEGLEIAVRHLRWLQRSGFTRFAIRIMDDGLSESGLERVAVLCTQNPSLILCSAKDFTEAIHKDAT